MEVSLCSLRLVEESDHIVSSMTTNMQLGTGTNSAIEDLLNSYQDIFNELIGLPHLKTHDHVIPLKEGSQPINLRLYRHSGLQKDVVKKIVTEILDSSIVQHNSSPFASLVVLVKKKDNT